MYDELFQCAYALTGNLELAEYVLRSALLEAYLRRGEWRERMSFHEGIAYALRAVSMAELRHIRSVGGFELDWALPRGVDLTPLEEALRDRVERESPRTQRLMLLIYGCGLKATQAGQALSLSAPGVKEGQRRLLSRLQRASGLGRREMETRMEALSEKLLLTPCPEAPACSQMLRAFERDAVGQTGRKASAGRVASVLFIFVGAILWLLTVLLEPRAPVQADSPPQATQAQIDANSSNNAG
jgi:DNA-directed RNA polymerase specialized sigma24 family protein